MSWKGRGASRSPGEVYVAILTALLFLAPVFDASAGNEQGWTPFGFGPRRVPAWFREAKLGMFIHWGPVSQVGQELSYPLLCCPLDDTGCDGAVSCIFASSSIVVARKSSTPQQLSPFHCFCCVRVSARNSLGEAPLPTHAPRSPRSTMVIEHSPASSHPTDQTPVIEQPFRSTGALVICHNLCLRFSKSWVAVACG